MDAFYIEVRDNQPVPRAGEQLAIGEMSSTDPMSLTVIAIEHLYEQNPPRHTIIVIADPSPDSLDLLQELQSPEDFDAFNAWIAPYAPLLTSQHLY